MPPPSDATSPMKRPAYSTTSSQQSVSRNSPGGTTIKSKPHRASLGRVHARTPSYGKNLHKLTKIISGDTEDGGTGSSKKKPVSPTSPNGTGPVRRNISALNLSKNAAKAPMRKNKSEVSLARNHFAAGHHRGKSTLPLRRNDSHGKELDKSKHHKRSTKFDLEDDEGDWTEESASPVLTRQSSLSKGSRQPSRVNTPPPLDPTAIRPDGTEDMSPTSPPDTRRDLANLENTARVQLFDRRQSRDMTNHPDILATQNVLSGKTLTGDAHVSFQTRPSQLSAANGSTPYPRNGVARFLETNGQTMATGGNSSAGISIGPLSSERSTMNETILGEMDSSRNSPASDHNMQESASTSNLPQQSLTVRADKNKETDLPSFTVSSTGLNRIGAATQNKLNLWRSQINVEATDGPPAPMLKEAHMDTLNNDERRMRLWENAEKELNAVRRFVNPVLESAKRAGTRNRSFRHVREPHGNSTAHTSYSTTPETKTNHLNGAMRRDHEGPRPPSRAGPHTVRFEVGVDNDMGRSYEGIEPVDEILRRLWSTSNDGTSVEG